MYQKDTEKLQPTARICSMYEKDTEKLQPTARIL